jgi:NYN domain
MTARLRTYIYVDGFNLYYRALRGTKFKWLNLEALAKDLLDPENDIVCIRYFTAPVSGKLDPGQPIRQQRYFQALQTLPCISIHQGNFLTKSKVRPLVHPAPGGPTHVLVWNSEEKGSDVNLATYLIHDAWRGLFDVALVLSQDTDLIEPVRIVRDEIKKPVGVVVLDGKAPGQLASYGSFVRHITHSRLAAAQFPDSMSFGRKGKSVQRPVEWS